jgi:hypothetical protein
MGSCLEAQVPLSGLTARAVEHPHTHGQALLTQTGSGTPSRTFDGPVRQSTSRTLDICTGSGIQAFLASRHSAHPRNAQYGLAREKQIPICISFTNEVEGLQGNAFHNQTTK